ncbi:hypothetical protein Tco_0064059 [Tanacetum coccineum]
MMEGGRIDVLCVFHSPTTLSKIERDMIERGRNADCSEAVDVELGVCCNQETTRACVGSCVSVADSHVESSQIV